SEGSDQADPTRRGRQAVSARKKTVKETPSSLRRDGKLSPDVRFKKDGAARMAAPTGRAFGDLLRHEGGTYLGGSGLPEPEMTSNEYLGMNDAEKTAYVVRLVRENHLVNDQELADAMHSDR